MAVRDPPVGLSESVRSYLVSYSIPFPFQSKNKRGKATRLPIYLSFLSFSFFRDWGKTKKTKKNSQNQRKLCGANSRAIDLLPPPGPGAEWTRDLPVDQGREADQVRARLFYPPLTYRKESIICYLTGLSPLRECWLHCGPVTARLDYIASRTDLFGPITLATRLGSCNLLIIQFDYRY